MNTNGLNVTIERQRLSEWINYMLSTSIRCLQETHFKCKKKYRLKANEWRKIYHANTNKKKAGTAVLISDIAELKVRKIIGDKGSIL